MLNSQEKAYLKYIVFSAFYTDSTINGDIQIND